jgi:hypothetical protein
MTRARPLRVHLGLALSFGAVLSIVGGPSVALADCMPPPAVEEAAKTADIVFVGTVTEVSNNSTWARVAVDEVWRGPDQEATVVIKGGPGGNSMTSVDRTFEVGVKYLFFPFLEQGEPVPGVDLTGLHDNSCSNTQQWDASLLPLRPADARAPLAAPTESSGFDFAGLIAPLGVALVVAVVLLGAGLLARGRQST